MIYLKNTSKLVNNKMPLLVCLANCDPVIGMWYILPKHALSFLDKKHSSLIFRIGKNSSQYNKLFSEYCKSRIEKHISLDIHTMRKMIILSLILEYMVLSGELILT